MTVERAILEIVHLHRDARNVVTIVCDQIGGRMTTSDRILGELSRRPRQRWRQLLNGMLVDVAIGAQSTLEIEDLHNDRDHGLPLGVRQAQLRVGGERRWLDVLIKLEPSGPAVLKELDGRLGHEGSHRFRDMRRDNIGVISGASQLRFGWADLAHDRCEVAALQALLWRRLGVNDVGRSCRRPGCRLEERVRRLDLTYPLLAQFRSAS